MGDLGRAVAAHAHRTVAPGPYPAEVSAEVETLTVELLDASRRYRAAKTRYGRRQRALVGRRNFDIELRDDPVAQRAVGDCSWYGSDMLRVGTALTALLAVDVVRAER